MPSLTSRALLTFGKSRGADPSLVSPTDAAPTHFLLTKMPSAFGQLQGNTPISDGKGTGDPREKHFGKRPKVMWGREEKQDFS